MQRRNRFLVNGRKCSLSNGSPCHTLFTASQLQAAHDECRQLTHNELDLVVLGQLRSLCQSDPVTQKTKAKNIERRRTTTLYRFGGQRPPGSFNVQHHQGCVCYSLFCSPWKQLTPQVVVTKPMSDLCWTCQRNSTLIMRAGPTTDLWRRSQR